MVAKATPRVGPPIRRSARNVSSSTLGDNRTLLLVRPTYLVPALRGPAVDVDDSIPGKPRVATAPFALVGPNIRIPALNDVNSIAAKSREAARAAALVLIQP